MMSASMKMDRIQKFLALFGYFAGNTHNFKILFPPFLNKPNQPKFAPGKKGSVAC